MYEPYGKYLCFKKLLNIIITNIENIAYVDEILIDRNVSNNADHQRGHITETDENVQEEQKVSPLFYHLNKLNTLTH